MLLVRTDVNELYKNTEYLSMIWKETDPRGHREFDMDWNMAFEAESKGVLHSWLVRLRFCEFWDLFLCEIF